MKAETPSFESQQIIRLRRGDAVRRLVQRDKTPLAVLLMAAVVGTLAGLVGVAFERAVHWVNDARVESLLHANSILVWPLAFILSGLLAMVGYWLVRRFAPEAGGSGIPEIEGALEELRPVRWWRVIPVKFIGGMGTLGAGMVLGREGPTVQLGGNVGRMVLDIFRLRKPEARHTLLATGAAAGLTAAFNAPLAGILFILEEMRPQFRYNLISIKAVFIGVIMSCVVFRIFNGESAVIEVGKLTNAPVNTLWLYLVLGMIFGCVGPLFNFLVLRTQDMFQRIHGGEIKKWVLIGGLLGGICGVLGLITPEAAGGGFNLIPIAAAGQYGVGLLMFIFYCPRGDHAALLLLRRAGRYFCADAGAGHPARDGVWHGGGGVVSRLSPAGGHLRHRRDGRAVCGLRARPAHRHRAGTGDDGQLPAHSANDYYLPGCHSAGTVPRRQAALFNNPGPHAGEAECRKSAAGKGARRGEYLKVCTA